MDISTQPGTFNWLDILDRPIAFQRIFVDITGSVHAALMLSQAFYWSNPKRNENPDGWFFKSQQKWEEETGLKRFEQEGARAKLRKTPFWKEERRGIPAQLYYRIDLQALENQLANKNAENQQSSMRKTSKQDRGKVTNKPAGFPQSIKCMEETTEETTEEKEENSLTTFKSFPGAVNGVHTPGASTSVATVALPPPKTKTVTTPISDEDWPGLRALLGEFGLPIGYLDDNEWWNDLSYTCNNPTNQWLAQEFAKMHRWLNEHPKQRPTKRWKTFLGGWLERAYENQRKGGRYAAQKPRR